MFFMSYFWMFFSMIFGLWFSLGFSLDSCYFEKSFCRLMQMPVQATHFQELRNQVVPLDFDWTVLGLCSFSLWFWLFSFFLFAVFGGFRAPPPSILVSELHFVGQWLDKACSLNKYVKYVVHLHILQNKKHTRFPLLFCFFFSSTL